MEAPSSVGEAADVLRAVASAGQSLRIRGGGTKLDWGQATEPPDVELSTERLDGVVEHNEGDLTAVLQAGARFARVQEALAQADQMIALDPPLGEADGATIGGIVATADSGPMRNRYGAVRDLILGVTVVLADGTVARAGGKVIKNVAGYDLAKLFTGSYGTLGLLVEVVMRLHPRPPGTVTVVATSGDPSTLGRVAAAVAHSPFNPQSLDVRWAEGRGDILIRLGGTTPEEVAEAVVRLVAPEGVETTLVADDEAIWEDQRARQRSSAGAVVRVSGLAADLPQVVRSAGGVGASLVGRAGLGLSWATLRDGDASEVVSSIEELRRRLHPAPCVVLDAPAEVREKIDVWGDTPTVPLLRRVKARFDPDGVCNPGIFVGGI